MSLYICLPFSVNAFVCLSVSPRLPLFPHFSLVVRLSYNSLVFAYLGIFLSFNDKKMKKTINK